MSRVDDDRLHPKGVEIPIFSMPISLDPLKGAARVGPIERGNQPLRPIKQFLAAGPHISGMVR